MIWYISYNLKQNQPQSVIDRGQNTSKYRMTPLKNNRIKSKKILNATKSK